MTFKISDICDINSSNLSAKDSYEFINYLDTSNLTEGVIDSLQKLVVGEDKIPSRAKRKVKKNDVLISTVRPNQKHYGILRKMNENLIVSTGFAVLSANEDRVVPEYLYRFLTQDSVTNYLQAVGETSTSTYPSIKPSDIGSLEIQLPSLEEQKVISKILSDLDKKIEVNNQINDNLEKMAQAIFKQWFVDFEFPNEDGEPYKSSGGEMVESELGMIPKGWRQSILGEVAMISAGGDKPKSFSKNITEENNIPIYSNGIDNEGLYGYTDKAKIFEEAITVSARGTIGYVCLRQQPYFPIVRLVSLVPDKNILSSKYLYFYLKLLNISGTGTTQQQLTVPDFKRTKICIPKLKIINQFTEAVNNIFNKIENGKSENIKLTEIRDTLLPKLMSGEIRVPLDNQ